MIAGVDAFVYLITMERKAATTFNKKSISVPGNVDIVTNQDPVWQSVLVACDMVAKRYGFTRVELPIIEDPSLYKVVYGDNDNRIDSLITTEVSNRVVSIRASLLPSVLRLLSGMKPLESELTKWTFSGSGVHAGAKQVATDYEFGLEVWGTFNHLTEAQVLGATWQLFSMLGLPDVLFEINICGNSASQEQYAEVLKEFLKSKRYEFCDTCADNISDNPTQVLRCVKIECQAVLGEAPTVLDYLDDASRKHFTNLLEALEELQIPYQLSPLLVGMEGATGTIVSLKLPRAEHAMVVAQAEGHSGLLQRLGGKPIHSFGLRVSLLKVHAALIERGLSPQLRAFRTPEVYLVPLGELAAKRSLRLFRDLTEAGVTVFDYFGYAGVKNQLKAAGEASSPIALIMGQKEAVDEVVILRDVKSGMQEAFSYDKIVIEVKKRLGR